MNLARTALLTCIAAMVILIPDCSRDHRTTSAQPVVAGQTICLSIQATISDAQLAYDSVYRDTSGRAFTVTDFRYYLSNAVAVREDGTEYPAPVKVILVDPARRAYDLGSLPEGTYKGLRFTIGLDSATNHSDPTVHPAGHPLAIQTPGMHWDWNSGYLFMKMEGKVDTSLKRTGAPAAEYFYHLGMESMKRTVDLPAAFVINKTAPCTLGVTFDLSAMLSVVDLRTELFTHTFDNLPLAARMADRWQAAFSVVR